MKKSLLATSAISALVAAQPYEQVNAAEWDIRVGGYYNAMVAYASDGEGATDRETHLTNDTELHFRPEITLDNGLKISAVIDINADVDDDEDSRGENASRTSIIIGGSFGEVIVGADDGAGYRMQYGAPNAAIISLNSASTAGYIDYQEQDWMRYTDVSETIFYIRPVDYLNRNLGEEPRHNKIRYDTPTFAGFTLSGSWGHDTGDRGSNRGLSSQSDTGQFEDVYDVALRYAGEFGGIRVAAGTGFQTGESEVDTREDLNSYHLHGSANYEGFGIGGAYYNHTDSGESTSASTNDARVYNLKGGYHFPSGIGVSIAGIDSESSTDDEYQAFEVGSTYNFAPGVTAYGAFTDFDAKDSAGSSSTNGYVIGTGIRLDF